MNRRGFMRNRDNSKGVDDTDPTTMLQLPRAIYSWKHPI